MRMNFDPPGDPGAYPFSHRLRVRFCETDAMGVVHHASYLAYLEETRVEYLRALDRPYQRLRAGGGFGAMTRRAGGRAGGAFSAGEARPPDPPAARRDAGGGSGIGWTGTGKGAEASDRPTPSKASVTSSGTDSYQLPVSR